MTDQPAIWDATAYAVLNRPHLDWGAMVLDRLSLSGNELVVDAGCGAGNLTALVLQRLPDGYVIAVDRSAEMLHEAKTQLLPRYQRRVALVRASLESFALAPRVDAVFSNATFHWIPDHDRLFASLARLLVPGGRLSAQFGGGPNIKKLVSRFERVALQLYPHLFPQLTHPWNFATVDNTRQSLERAGFTDVDTQLVATPVIFRDAAAMVEYLGKIIFFPQLRHLEPEFANQILGRVATMTFDEEGAYMADYWRINAFARGAAVNKLKGEDRGRR